MTIIKPGSYRASLNYILWFFVIILIGGSFYIFEYNNFVGSRDSLKKIKSSIAELQVKNADLKNSLYEVTSGPKLERFAEENGLIIDKNPTFLSTSQWLSDSSH